MRAAFALLWSCLVLSVAFLVSPANAGDWYDGDGYSGGYYGGGYYRTGYYGDDHYRSRYYDDGYYRSRYYDDGYSYRPRHHGHSWYSSSCCYRRVVRHTAWYERTYRDYSSYDDGYSWYSSSCCYRR